MILSIEIIASVSLFIQLGCSFSLFNCLFLFAAVISIDHLLAFVLYKLFRVELATGLDVGFGFDCDNS